MKHYKWILFFLITCLHLQAAEPELITKDEVLKVAQTTKAKIETIKGYQFLLVKREIVEGKDTDYQYLNVRVRTEPLAIYIKFLKPKRYEGREAIYFDGEVVAKRGGTRMSNMVVHILPDSPMAMEGNRYPITYINPKVLATELIQKIEQELAFPETKLEVYRQAKVYNQFGTHYRLTHTAQKDGMECYIAEVMISNDLGLPIYFRVIDFQKRVLEEYAFKDMSLDPQFSDQEFTEDNPAYGFLDAKKALKDDK